MAFAIDEINRNSYLLPNVTLGYQLYDNCAKLGVGFRAALSLANVREKQFLLNESCLGSVLGIVGPGFVQVSYFATCSCLSDRRHFPSFFRTIPSDAFQVRAMLQIHRQFGWTWVGLLVSDDDYGLDAAQSLKSDLAQSGGGCVVLPLRSDPAEFHRIVGVKRRSTAHVVIVFGHESQMIQLITSH